MSLTPKMERFAQCIVSGMSGKDAYYTAYNTTCNEKTAYTESMKLLKRDDITERIKEMRKPLENHAVNTAINERQKQLKEIDERIELCKQKDDEQSLIRWYDMKNKIMGLYTTQEEKETKTNVITELDTTTLLRLVE